MIEDWDRGVAGQDEVAVHAVDKEDGVVVGWGGRWDGGLGCGEALRDDSAAIDSARAGWVPEFTER